MSELLIVNIAKKRFENLGSSNFVSFIGDDIQDEFLNDLSNNSHAYVLGCLMDRQIKSERAWSIPYKIYRELGTFDIYKLAELDEHWFINFFNTNKIHRFNNTFANIFFLTIKDIVNKYDGKAFNIWVKKPSSASVVSRFLQFKGSGIKIANMAANILARQFKIPFSDYCSIDISPDVHTKRVMKRMGFIEDDSTTDYLIYKARELYPQFPGIIDFSCWEIAEITVNQATQTVKNV